MSDNEETSEKSPTATFGTISILANHPLAADSNEAEPHENELTTNIIKDASKVAGENTKDDDDDNDSEEKMNKSVQDLQSDSIIPDEKTLSPRKSITASGLDENQENLSTPAINDSLANNRSQGPRRSMSESTLIDHHDTTELPSTLPIQKNENSTDAEEFAKYDANEILNDNQQISSTTKENSDNQITGLEKTSRNQSATSKRSPSPSINEKCAEVPDETAADREVANISRRPSLAKSPINRPESPTPTNSRKSSANIQTKRPQSSSSEQKQTNETASAVISPGSRPGSTNKADQKQSSRPSSSLKSKANDDYTSSSSSEQKKIDAISNTMLLSGSRPGSTTNIDQKQTSRPSSSLKSRSNDDAMQSTSNTEFLSTNEQSKLIKPGEQLQIPTNDLNNEQVNSPPPSPSAAKTLISINPLLTNNSRPASQTSRRSPPLSTASNEKVIDGDVVSSKSRRSSQTSQQQILPNNQKPNSASIRKDSATSKSSQKEQIVDKKDSRRSSKDSNVPIRTSAEQKEERISPTNQQQSPVQGRSRQSSRKNSTDQTIVAPIKINSAKSEQKSEQRLNIADTEQEQKNTSKLPRLHSSSTRSATPTNENQTNTWVNQTPIAPIQTTDDDLPQSRPQSPNVEQIAERNPILSTNKKQKTDEQKKKEKTHSVRRSNSAESFNHIRLVDDKSLDSTSGNNTEAEHSKPRRIKSKKKDVETNTDSRNGNQQQESMTERSPSIRRRIPTKEYKTTTPDSESDGNTSKVRRPLKKPKESTEHSSQTTKDKENLPKEQERQTLSDTEQIITDKQKKRRRPKRISRTTQTYECVFRRMEREQHEELKPTNETEKNIQTKKSHLRPTIRSPKKHYPIYLSTNAFKMEEILPKQFPQNQRNISKTSVVARNHSPPSGKLLILRPTLPFHHTDAVNVQRISLQYAIDLVPNENKSTSSTPDPRHKSHALKQSEQTNNLPMIRSSSSTANTPTNKSNTKDKSNTNRNEDRTSHRKSDGII